MEIEEMIKNLDMRGSPCPLPVVNAKKELEKKDGVIVLVDNIVAVQNLQKMANGKNYSFSYIQQNENSFEVTIKKHEGIEIPMIDPSASPDRSGVDGPGSSLDEEGVVVLISGDSMGRGSEELGKILLKGFIFSLTELQLPPKAVIFFNSGVNLAVEGSNTLKDLEVLSVKGSKILACGTCLNYYKLTDKLAAGEITDMYTIAGYLSSAARLITV